MHIPKSDTQHTEILTFEEAQKHREESAVYDREKWLYIPDCSGFSPEGCHNAIMFQYR